MTRAPDFDELIGAEPDGAERERLRRVHDLIVAAGPPPELSPQLEAGPDMLVTYRHRRRAKKWRRAALLAATLAVLAVAFFVGYISGNDSKPVPANFAPARVVAFEPTAEAPNASATLGFGKRDSGGNWPMRLVASGLPRLSGNDYYAVLLTKNGKVIGYCGGFLVKEGRVTAYLNAPYRLAPDVDWIVTVQHPGTRTPGPVVLRT